MKDLIDRMLLETKKGDWEKTFESMHPDIDAPEYGISHPHKPGERVKVAKLKDPLDVCNVIDAYNEYITYDRYAPDFPLYGKSKAAIKVVLKELLTTGTLIQDSKTKIPKPIYAEYREDLNDAKEIARLSMKVREVQTLIAWGKHWKSFFNQLNPPLVRITDIKQSHGANFQSWRMANRIHGEQGKKISHNQVKREVSYMRSLLEWAISENIISKNVLRGFKIRKPKLDVEEGVVERPFSMNEVSEILRWAYHNWRDYPASSERDKKRKRARKLNWLTMVLLACVGCRPKEVNQFSLRNGQLSFVGGKTYSARRTILPTPTILKIISDPLFKDNGKSVGVAQRISQYMERGLGKMFGTKAKEFTSYRFRHFVATIRLYLGESPQLVANQMGHSSSRVTEEKYTRLKVMIDGGGAEKASKFWRWLNEEYFKDPERTDFSVPGEPGIEMPELLPEIIVRMPPITGLQAIKALRKSGGLPKKPSP